LRTQDFGMYIGTDGRTYGEVQILMSIHNFVGGITTIYLFLVLWQVFLYISL